jgi:hypothetical protein
MHLFLLIILLGVSAGLASDSRLFDEDEYLSDAADKHARYQGQEDYPLDPPFCAAQEVPLPKIFLKESDDDLDDLNKAALCHAYGEAMTIIPRTKAPVHRPAQPPLANKAASLASLLFKLRK